MPSDQSATPECNCRPPGNPSVIGACACPVHGMKALRRALEEAVGSLGSLHVAEEGPNAGWRDGTEYDIGWYDDDLHCKADCPVCAVVTSARAALDQKENS